MKSGLYACAGASATASAAACAKRFDDPITNESKVYFGFSPIPTRSPPGTPSGPGRPRPDPERVEVVLGVQPDSDRLAPVHLAGLGPLTVALGHGELDPPLVTGRVAHGRADPADEVALDQVAREVVPHGEG